MKKVLVADDDANIREVVCFALENAGILVVQASDGLQAIDAFLSTQPDLIVLDVGMPEMDGLEVCRVIRKNHETPILFLSARDEEIDRIIGLEIGGDDYVTKPFSPRELVARVNVILKRTSRVPSQLDHTDIMVAGALTLIEKQHRVTLDEETIDLTPIEFRILKTLLARPKMVFSREHILDLAYNDNIHVSDRTIDSHVRNIRSKMKNAMCSNVIETVHGAGFRIGPCTLDHAN